MFEPLSLKAFYTQTLKEAGFVPQPEQIEKFASDNKLDIETTKIAAMVFEQLQLDGVPYETSQDAFKDAIKIATEYVDHVKIASENAEKLAGDLHRIARHAVEGYLAQHGITDITADEGVKIAGLQATGFQKLEQKQAALPQQQPQAKQADEIIGGATPPSAPVESSMHATPGMLGRIGNTIAERPGLTAGVGALGLGALYLMKHKREQAAADARQNTVSAATLPPA